MSIVFAAAAFAVREGVGLEYLDASMANVSGKTLTSPACSSLRSPPGDP